MARVQVVGIEGEDVRAWGRAYGELVQGWRPGLVAEGVAAGADQPVEVVAADNARSEIVAVVHSAPGFPTFTEAHDEPRETELTGAAAIIVASCERAAG